MDGGYVTCVWYFEGWGCCLNGGPKGWRSEFGHNREKDRHRKFREWYLLRLTRDMSGCVRKMSVLKKDGMVCVLFLFC